MDCEKLPAKDVRAKSIVYSQPTPQTHLCSERRKRKKKDKQGKKKGEDVV
jgi:hypothetical protein